MDKGFVGNNGNLLYEVCFKFTGLLFWICFEFWKGNVQGNGAMYWNLFGKATRKVTALRFGIFPQIPVESPNTSNSRLHPF